MLNGDSSRILAIDPGEMTGISYLKDGEFVWGMVCRPEAFDSEPFVMGLIQMTKPTTIVIESPPHQTAHYNKDQYRIFEMLVRKYEIAGHRVVKMNPGLWKNLVAREKIDFSHARDAADMGKVRFSQERGQKKNA